MVEARLGKAAVGSEAGASSSEPVPESVSEARRCSSLEEDEAPEASRSSRRPCLFSITSRARSCCGLALLLHRSLADSEPEGSEPVSSSDNKTGIRLLGREPGRAWRLGEMVVPFLAMGSSGDGGTGPSARAGPWGNKSVTTSEGVSPGGPDRAQLSVSVPSSPDKATPFSRGTGGPCSAMPPSESISRPSSPPALSSSGLEACPPEDMTLRWDFSAM